MTNLRRNVILSLGCILKIVFTSKYLADIVFSQATSNEASFWRKIMKKTIFLKTSMVYVGRCICLRVLVPIFNLKVRIENESSTKSISMIVAKKRSMLTTSLTIGYG
jgi:hypothetical protein